MAAIQIIDIGTGEVTSDDVTVEAGSPLMVFLNDAAGDRVEGGEAIILIKDPTGQFFQIGKLLSDGYPGPSGVLFAPGTYRFKRTAESAVCGVASA